MATKADVIKRAKELDVTVRFLVDSGKAVRGTVYHEIVITAPPGHLFAGMDVHECVVASQVDGAPIETLYDPALADMKAGVELCDIPDCEWCADE